MTLQRTQVPAVEGWFTTGDSPHLIGAKCTGCGTYVFPPRSGSCPNPDCDSTELAAAPLAALKGLSPTKATALSQGLGVTTIGDLAANKLIQAATTIAAADSG